MATNWVVVRSTSISVDEYGAKIRGSSVETEGGMVRAYAYIDRWGDGNFNNYYTSWYTKKANAEYSVERYFEGRFAIIIELRERFLELPSIPSTITVPLPIRKNQNISISWGSSTDVDKYYLERQVNDGSWTVIYEGINRSYTDTSQLSWKTVRYRVRGYNPDGYSDYRVSPIRNVNTLPTIPSSIAVPDTIKSGEDITISWGASTDADGDSISYSLERSINGGSWSQVYSGSGRSKFETPLPSWNTVSYRVRAYDGEEYSSYRTSATRTVINNTAPSTPSSIDLPSVVKGGETLAISWGTSTDTDGNLSGYILERSVNGGAYTQIYKGANRSFTDSIAKGWNAVAYRVKAYDSEGLESGYTTSATRTVINNTAPTISGQDSNLGDKNLGFVILYQVDDIDTSDSLVVTEKLNNSTLQIINGAPRKKQLEIEITNEMLFNLGLNSTNTIEIKVDDQQGGIAYRRYTFRRTNTAPIISDRDQDLGQKTEPFSIDFSTSDYEGNIILVKTYLNGIKKEEYQAEDGATNKFTISNEDWIKLPISSHSIKIEAIDEHKANAIRNYTFTRYDNKIQFNLKNPIETDIGATKILVTPTWTIPAGAVAKVEACNNAFDEVQTWEDITSQVLISRHYNFTNDVKTADEWGIDVRFTIEKGTATDEVIVNGFGGAFE